MTAATICPLKKMLACSLCLLLLTGINSIGQECRAAQPAPLQLTGGVALSPEAASMAEQLNLLERIHQLDEFKGRNSGNIDRRSNDALANRQDLIEARQGLLRAIIKADLEADYVLAAIDGENNDYSKLVRELASSRDTAILMNTIVTQLINGVFWSLSGIFTLVSVDHIQASNPDGISSIIAGSVPAFLSLYALYQVRGPKRQLSKHPNMLAPLFTNVSSDDGYYPEAVLHYLNTAPAGKPGTPTRKETLIQHWTQCKMISKNGTVPSERKVGLMTGTIEKRRALTISLLQDRQTMLSDVRTEVCQMKRGLVELMPLLDE